MIVTVTINPAIDKTVEIDALVSGGLNRIQSVEYDAGGKGINVSKTLKELGAESIATGFLGGNTGKTIETVLNENGIKNEFIRVDGETRTNTKVVEIDGNVTELNEPGPMITYAQVEELLDKLSGYASPDTLFVLSGSIPRGVDPSIYAKITKLAHEKGAKVLIDADGEPFRRAVAVHPDMIKPNRHELMELAGLSETASEEQLINAARRLAENGIKIIVVSLGKKGAFFIMDGFEVKCPPVSVKVRSTVGAGDAMVAALAYAFENDLEGEESVRLCMAASAGAVTTSGTKPAKRETVDELVKNVKVIALD